MSLCDLFLHKNIIYALKDSIDGFFCTKSKMEAEIIQKIWDVIDIETAELPSRVLDLEWIMAEKILRVYIENTDGTQVEMDHCVAFTRQIKDNEAIDGLVTAPTYQLEVSSPGVEKPLRKPEHFSDVKDQMVFVMESTGVYHEALAYALYDAGCRVAVTNPQRSKDYAKALGVKNKTDKRDSFVLAHYAYSTNPRLWQP